MEEEEGEMWTLLVRAIDKEEHFVAYEREEGNVGLLRAFEKSELRKLGYFAVEEFQRVDSSPTAKIELKDNGNGKWDTMLYVVTMPDGTRWGIPVSVIARHRAENYADEFDGDVERSLAEDTYPLFDESRFEIRDWAANNMNWSDVKPCAMQLPTAEIEVDYEDGWCNGEYNIVEPLGKE